MFMNSHLIIFTTTDATGFNQSAFGSGLGSVYLSQHECVGNETRLVDCPSNPLRSHNCSLFRDAGARCDTVTPSKSA